MGIKIFVNSLLALGIAAYFIPVENKTSLSDDKDIPLVVFEKPYMYTLDEVSVSREINASHAVKYKNRDEMFNADIILKNKPPKDDFIVEKLKAKTIISHGDILTFKEDVSYKRDNFIDLTTDKLYYNTKDKIAYNDVAYQGNYYKNHVEGTHLYLDMSKNYIKSKKVHFEVDMKNK